MTLNEFFTALVRTKETMVWYKDGYGKLRAKKNGSEGLLFCPINAVCYNEKELYLPTFMIFPLMKELNMDFKDGQVIFAASDNINTDLLTENMEVRRRLEQVLL